MSDPDLSRRAIAAGLRWAPGMRTTTGWIVAEIDRYDDVLLCGDETP